MSYLSAVLANAPRHYWRLADRGGSVANDLGSSKLALIEILAGSGPGVALAKPLGYSGCNTDGGCAVMGSTGLSADEAFNYSAPITFEIVVWRFVQPANDVYLLGVGASGTGFAGVGILANGNYLIADGVHAQADALFAVTSNAWHHVVLTQDGVNSKLYIDSVLKATIASGAFAHVWRPSIGNKPDIGSASGVPVAALSEAAIYTSALTQAQVSAHFAAIDNAGQPPVNNSAGLGTAAPVTTVYTDRDAALLAFVSRLYQNAP